jgi:phage terminase large subunit-like protein
LHAHQTREIYDVIETGTGKRTASLLWVITTAGSDTSGICYEVRGYAIKVLEGVHDDESQFGIIYTLDEGDDWTSPESWRKANPNWGVSVQPDLFAQLAEKAQTQMSAQNNFKTKCLNLWVSADVQWMEMRAWDRCAVEGVKPEEFKTEALYIGLDLATKTDIAAKVYVFIRMHPMWKPGCGEHSKPGAVRCGECYNDSEPSEPHYYFFLESYLPELAVTDGRNAQYQGWVLEGYLTETPGDVTDFLIIKAGIVADLAKYRLRDVAFDPWQSAQMAQELSEHHGINMVEIRATVANFSQPMKEFESLVLAGRLHHDGNPVFRWMVSNVVCRRDANDNVFPRKGAPQNKIDGAVASFMGLSRALTEDDPYATGGLKSLG